MGDPVGDELAAEYDRGFTTGYVAAVLAMVAGTGDVSPVLREAAAEGLRLIKEQAG
jgi:hypothetical protein